MSEAVDVSRQPGKCAECSTELAPHAVDCPACHALVFRSLLTTLAATAQDQASRGDLAGERTSWTRALNLLPADSQQYAHIRARVDALTALIEADPPSAATAAPAAKKPVSGPWWRRWAATGGAVILLALGKLKFLVFGLTKLSTLLSMFAFFGVYWTTFGWPLALGFVISIYIHEMGHVAMLRRLGIKAGAPFFIPGLGALVLLKQRVDNPVDDAKIGLAGPVWGLGAGAAAYAVGLAGGPPIWFAIARLTGYLNLFNLIPVWQLDGSRGFHALGRWARWGIAVTALATMLVTHQKLLLIIGAVATYRALFHKTDEKTHWPTFATFVGLIVILSFMAGAGRPFG